MTTDELRIILRINGAATYTHTINEVTNVTNNYNKSVGNLISTLAKLVSAGAMIKFGKQCIEAASNLQEVQNVVDVTFGSMAKDIDKWAKSQAASFGLSEKAAKEYAGRYGTMAQQFGMTRKQAAAMAVELTKLTGDVASFYNITDSTAATKLKAIFTGETEGLKELGVVMTEAQLNAYAMSNGWGKTTKDMTEQEKVVLRYQYTMEKLAHAQGDFARTSDGYANSVRSLKLELENLKIEIGKELIPVAAMGIQAISSIIKTVGPTIVKIAQNIRLYATAWKNASEYTKAFAKVAMVAIGVMVVIPKVIAITSKVMDILKAKTITTTMALQAMAGIIGIIFAMAAFRELNKQVEQLREQEANLGESADVSADAVDELAGSLDNLGDSTKGLETFLASFDEVNKVGGNTSLMSSLVNAQDLDNILGAVDGIDELQESLNTLELPSLGEDTIFSADWWKEKGKLLLGFMETWLDPKEFWENWWSGIYDLDNLIEQLLPQWHAKFTNLGAAIYDALHPDADRDTRETFTYTNSKTGKVSEGLKYNADGSYSQAYLNSVNNAAAAAASKAPVTNNNTNNNTYGPQKIDIILDSKVIASSVIDNVNAQTRSTGMSPFVG